MPALLNYTVNNDANCSVRVEGNDTTQSNLGAFNPGDVFVWEGAGDALTDEQVLHLGTADHLGGEFGCGACNTGGVDCLLLLDE